MPQPPGPSSPRDQLKATLREIIKKQKSLLTPQGVSDYLAGYSEGFIAGKRHTQLDQVAAFLAGTDCGSTGNGLVAVYRGVGKVGTVIGDLAGSLWNWTTPSTAIQAGRTARRVANNAVITVQNAGAILADLYAMAGELEAIVGTNLVRGLFGAPVGHGRYVCPGSNTRPCVAADARDSQLRGLRRGGTRRRRKATSWAWCPSRSSNGRSSPLPPTGGRGDRKRGLALANRKGSRRRGSVQEFGETSSDCSALRELKVAGRTAGEIAGI